MTRNGGEYGTRVNIKVYQQQEGERRISRKNTNTSRKEKRKNRREGSEKEEEK
jgi:hypothetical protein